MTRALLEKALAAVKEAEKRKSEPIAIVGRACRFPGADTPEAFWSLLASKRDAIGPVPANRFRGLEQDGSIVAGFVEDADAFDHRFFDVPAGEAALIDPQHRMVLEVAHAALEDACVPSQEARARRAGVYVGASTLDYSLHMLRDRSPEAARALAVGSSLSPAAGRISYTLGLTGPSFAVDSACSSSLLALHLAVDSLRRRECDVAIVAGVNVIGAPFLFESFRRSGLLSSDGRCRAFSAEASGYVRGEGAAAVVLMRAGDTAGRRVLALIRGTAVNHNGANGNLTFPSGSAQADVIRRALDAARTKPEEVDYVEAHGTATRLGDALELEALASVFPGGVQVGSVKTNVGHLEAAAGLAGLLKILGQLEHGRVAPHLHLGTPSPELKAPLTVPTELRPWPKGEKPRVAGLSAFGFTGTNVHAVIAEPEPPEARPAPEGVHTLVISGKTPEALARLSEAYANFLETTDVRIDDICHSAAAGRERYAHVRHVRGETPAELAAALRAGRDDPSEPRAYARARFVSLPTYPFDRVRHWVGDPAPEEAAPAPAAVERELLTLAGLPEDTDPRSHVLDLGLDSLALLQLRDTIEKTFEVEVPLSTLIEEGTIRALAQKLGPRRNGTPESTAPRPIEGPDLPLTPLQEAYLSARLHQTDVGCHVFSHLEIDAPLDEAVLRRAFDRLCERHPMLGAVFDAGGTQRVGEARMEIPIDDLSHEPEGVQQVRCEAVEREMIAATFDPLRGPLIAARAVRIGPSRFRLLLCVDLMIVDVVSLYVLIDELRRLYEDPDVDLGTPPPPFSEHLSARRTERASERFAAAKSYWMGRLGRLPDAPDLAPKKTRGGFGSRSHILSEKDLASLREQCKRERVTLASLVGTAYAESIARHSQGRDFRLTVPALARTQLDAVGPYTDTIWVRADGRTDEKSFFDRARALQREMLEALEHRAFSGIELGRLLIPLGGGAAAPVVFTPALFELPTWGRTVALASRTPGVLIDAQALFREGGMELRFDYDARAFDEARIDAIFSDFTEAVVRSIRPRVEPSSPVTLDRMFLERAVRTPHQRAIAWDDGSWTYEELEARSAGVAERVRGLPRVAVAIDRGPKQVAAVLGILRAGGAYVPLDVNHPDRRLAAIIESARPSLVLTDEKHRGRFSDIPTDTIDRLSPCARLGSLSAPGDLAYIIYTSGSTGAPKGVMISHAGATNTIQDINRRFSVGAFDRVFAFSSLAFDLSVYDIFGTLAAGATIVTMSEEDRSSPKRWAGIVARQGVTVWSSVPIGMSMLVGEVEPTSRRSLRLILLSGDWIPVTLPDRVRSRFPQVEIVSLGGATEASIWSCIHTIGEVDLSAPSIPYGRALSNQSLLVLDDDLKPTDEGELFIGGAGVALGYWDDPERSASRFLDLPQGRVFRTGDLVRTLPTGELELLGRRDHQVKIRGFRVEIAEVEAHLSAQEGVRACAVVARGDPKGLLGFYVADRGLPEATLIANLRSSLPDYMVPERLVRIETLPLNVNGKVDRSALEPPR